MANKKLTAAALGRRFAKMIEDFTGEELDVLADEFGRVEKAAIDLATPGAVAAAADLTTPREEKPRENPSATPAAGEKLLAAEDAPAAEEGPPTFIGDCPSCGSPLEIADGVERFACPECKTRIAIARARDDEDKAPERNPRGLFAIFARHHR